MRERERCRCTIYSETLHAFCYIIEKVNSYYLYALYYDIMNASSLEKRIT